MLRSLRRSHRAAILVQHHEFVVWDAALSEDAVNHIDPGGLQIGAVLGIGVLNGMFVSIDTLLVAQNHSAALGIAVVCRLEPLLKAIWVIEFVKRSVDCAAILVHTIQQRGYALK